jgi:hypothetical protein
MERALVILEEEREVVGHETPPPCDESGSRPS